MRIMIFLESQMLSSLGYVLQL